MTAAQLPSDIPVFTAPSADKGVLLPATSFEPEGMYAWDPWTFADVAKMVDHSMPAAGADNYGEPFNPGRAASIVANWGEQFAPVLDYQDEVPSVAIVPRTFPKSHGQAGQFLGAQESATEYNYEQPDTDYWSVLTGQS